MVKNYNHRIALVFLVLALSLSLFETRNGTAIPTGDSSSNLICSKSIKEIGIHGWPNFILNPDGSTSISSYEKNTVWPPVTAGSIAALTKIGLSEFIALRLFTILFAGLSVFLTSLLAFRITKSNLLTIIVSSVFLLSWEANC